MSKKPVVFFTIADKNNIEYANKMAKSLKKFHPDIPLKIYDQKELDSINDQHKFYRATPLFARELIKEYGLVVKIDADSIVTGDLSNVLIDEGYDIGCVYNNNRVDPPISIYDIPPKYYVNCGFVAMRSEEAIEHWWKLCQKPFFFMHKYREQDMLNILYHFGNYRTKMLDDGNDWYGLISKGEWLNLKRVDSHLVLPPTNGYPKETKTIKVLHVAGGNVPNKMNFHIRFKEDIAKYLEELTNE